MNAFILLLIGHFLADFSFQSYRLAELKQENVKYLFIHTLIYWVFILLPIALFAGLVQAIMFYVIILVSHFLIDYFRIKLNKKYNSISFNFWSFIIDQILHIAILFIFSLPLTKLNVFGEWLSSQINIGYNLNYLAKVVLAFILVLSPASVFIKHLFNYVFVKENESNICLEDKENRVGSLIGKLERILVLIFGMMGLYSSIALVLTAKSIARFKQLEDKEFAEKYLVGTLISILIAILCLFIT